MIDREKVMNALYCRAFFPVADCEGCVYREKLFKRYGCNFHQICKDALELLKEVKQEMDDEHIQMIDNWFDNHHDYGTYHEDDEYVVQSGDMRDFCDLIDEIPDLIYIPCVLRKEGIFFTSEDLKKARYY